MVQYSDSNKVKSLKIAVYFLAALLLSKCEMSSNKSGVGDLVEIDISKKYPEKEMLIQDLGNVEYIPLETNKNTLMRSRARIVHVSDYYIIASNTTDGDVFIFDGKGKSKFSFNREGRSGTEYNILSSIAFDEKAKEIFIFDRTSANPKFLVYAEDGEFKRSFTSPSSFTPKDMFNFDDETLLVYDDYGLLLSGNRYSKKPYMLLSKKDGSIVDTLGIHLPVRLSNRVLIDFEKDGQTYSTTLNLIMLNNCSYGINFLIADMSSDTIYRLTPKKLLQPMIVRKPPIQSTEPKMVITSELITDDFILLTKGVLDFELAKRTMQFQTVKLMYEFKTGQLNEYKLLNKDYESSKIDFRETITPENTGIILLDVAELFETDEAGKIKGELKQLLKSLNEEDNPILMKIKF